MTKVDKLLIVYLLFYCMAQHWWWRGHGISKGPLWSWWRLCFRNGPL